MPATPRQRLRAALAPDAHKMMLDASVPEAIRRCKRWELALMLAGVAVFFTYIVLWECGVLAHLPTPLFMLLMMLPTMVVVICGRLIKRALRRAAAADHLLCPDCTYDLRTLDANGTCPECGRAYDHAAVRAQWLEAERRLRRGKDRRAINEPPA